MGVQPGGRDWTPVARTEGDTSVRTQEWRDGCDVKRNDA